MAQEVRRSWWRNLSVAPDCGSLVYGDLEDQSTFEPS